MQIESLRYFLKLAEVGTFSAAARDLFISQQGLSKAIGALESNLGVKLFERSHRGVTLTRNGKVLQRRAEALVAEYDSILDEIIAEDRQDQPNTKRLHLRSTFYGIRALDALRHHGALQYGRVTVSECSFSQILSCLDDNSCTDVLLAELYPATERELMDRGGVAFFPLIPSVFGVVWRKGCGLEGKRSIHRDEIAGKPCARISSRDLNFVYKRMFEGVGAPDLQLECSSPHKTLDFVNETEGGIALLDSFGFFLCQSDPTLFNAELHFTPFASEEANFKLGILVNTRAKQSELVQRSIMRLQAYAQEEYRLYIKTAGLENLL